MSLDIVTTIGLEDRDSFGQYEIQPGHTLVFPFIVPALGSTRILLQHTKQNSQDSSILAWITSAPLDGIQLELGFGRLRLSRAEQYYTIWDNFLRHGQDDDRLFLTNSRAYYLNIKNLQNSSNAFDLLFD
jgi:hypothetical protein